MINAPFTPDQVTNLNRFQNRDDIHPFTCPGERLECERDRRLIATEDGWICPCGEYQQLWAHEMMVTLGEHDDSRDI